MDRLNLISFIFLVVLFVLAPRAALRSARMLRQLEAAGAPLPRRRLTLSTMFALAMLWAISEINAQMLGRNVFSMTGVGMREWALGAAAFGLLLTTIPISRAMEAPGDNRSRVLYSMAPRNGRELGIFALVAAMAGIAEETAYRGVAIWILTPVVGHMIPAMLLSAAAFAVAHAVQGGRAMALVFVTAAVFHALVYLSGTLVIAMVVHAAYDIVAGRAAGVRARQVLADQLTPERTVSPEPPTAPERSAG